MDLITYALLRQQLKKLVTTGGLETMDVDGTKITFTSASGATATLEMPVPSINSETGNWAIGGVDTGVPVSRMTLIEY